jgi:PAS domain S-box-containing protein
MPPLISLETSPLKFDAMPRASRDGTTVELEFIDTDRSDDSNVIQINGREIFRRETAYRDLRSELKMSYYSQLFENSPAAIVLLDTYDHVIDLNPAFTKIFQYTLDEIKNFPLTNFIVPKGRMREAIEMTLRTLRGEAVLQTLERKRKDGSLVQVELSAFPVKLEGSRIGIYTIYTDVSQKIIAERKTAECEKFADLGALAGGAARGFNAVLGVLMADVKQLMQAMPEGATRQKTYWEMNAAIDRGVELVGRLLAFAGRTDVHPETKHADIRMEELTAMMQSIAEEAPPLK